MGYIRQFYPQQKNVGTDVGGTLLNIFSAEGFYHELEEDDHVIWKLYASNSGPSDIFAVYCKPFASGPWQIVDQIRVPAGANSVEIKKWRADNEDHFFFFQTAYGQPVPFDPNIRYGTDGNTWSDMWWHWQLPNQLVLALRLAERSLQPDVARIKNLFG